MDHNTSHELLCDQCGYGVTSVDVRCGECGAPIVTADRHDGSGTSVETPGSADSGPDRFRRRGFLQQLGLASAVGAGLVATGAQTGTAREGNEGGPVVLMGLDSELGAGSSDHGPPHEHAAMVESILADVTNGGEGILVIGASGSDPQAYWEQDIGGNVGESVEFVNGPSAIREQSFEGYAMLGVASSDIELFGRGGLTDAENEALIDRGPDVAEFVNDGGGLLGKSQTGLSNEWVYADPLRVFETRTGLGYSSIDMQPPGEELGLSQDGMSGWCCWHDTFIEFPDIYDVLVLHDDGGSGHGEPAAIGGAQIVLIAEVDLRFRGPAEFSPGEPTEFDLRLRNGGDETPEPVRVEYEVRREGDIEPDDLDLSYYDADADDWQKFPLSEGNSYLVGSISPKEGFPLPEQFDHTTELRATFSVTETYTIEATVVGVGDEEGEYDSGSYTVRPDAQPKIVSADLPPTAIRTNHRVRYGLTIDPAGLSADELDLSSQASLEYRGDFEALASAESTVSERDDGLLDVEFELPAPSELHQDRNVPMEGLLYDISVRGTLGGVKLGSFARTDRLLQGTVTGDEVRFQTASFRSVDTVATIPGQPADREPDLTGTALLARLRGHAEFVNRYYASGMGSMGAKGFDFQVPFSLEESADGWVELDGSWDRYSDGPTRGSAANSIPDNSMDYIDDTLTEAALEFDVDFESWDTALAVNERDLSRPFYAGDIQAVVSDIFGLPVDLGGLIPVEPVDTPTGTIDCVYNPIDRPSWRHEFGHSLGPGNRVGFPDLYEMDELFQSFGDIGNWGLMGHGETITSFCRWLGEEPDSMREGWFDADMNVHVISDQTIELDRLTDTEIGDDMHLVVSPYSYASAQFGYPPIEQRGRLDLFILEERPATIGSGIGQQVDSIEYPESMREWLDDIARRSPEDIPERVQPSPATDANSGFAIYKFGQIDLGPSDVTDTLIDIAQAALDDDLSSELQNFPEAIDELTTLRYLEPESGGENEFSVSSASDSLLEEESATEFTIEGSNELRLHRDAGLLGTGIQYLISALSDVEDAIFGHGGFEVLVPPFDVIAETPDGRRVGTDPETGEVINEIDGAEVCTRGTAREIFVPRGEQVDIRVSTVRTRVGLEEEGLEIPDELTYTERLLIDDDPVINHDEVAMIENRLERRRERTIGETDDEPIVWTDARVDPDRINVDSEGNFVTARLRIPDAYEVDDLVLESVAARTVPAVVDDQYGFVDEPPVETIDGDPYVKVKFDRAAFTEAVDLGEQTVTFSGMFDETIFYGTASVELFEPGSGNQGNGDGAGDNDRGGNGDGNRGDGQDEDDSDAGSGGDDGSERGNGRGST